MTVPELPEAPITVTEALKPLFEPPFSGVPLETFIEQGWWKAAPDETDGQIMMLWLRYRQTAVALAVVSKAYMKLEERVRWLESKEPVQ